jgi:hypothetical protein
MYTLGCDLYFITRGVVKTLLSAKGRAGFPGMKGGRRTRPR